METSRYGWRQSVNKNNKASMGALSVKHRLRLCRVASVAYVVALLGFRLRNVTTAVTSRPTTMVEVAHRNPGRRLKPVR